MVESYESAVLRVDVFFCEPLEKWLASLIQENVAEVAEWSAGFWLRVDYFFIESTGFADLPHGVVSEGLLAELGEENLWLDEVECWVAVADASLWGEEEFDEVGVIGLEEADEALEFVVNFIAFGIADLIDGFETAVERGWGYEYAAEIVVRVSVLGAKRSATTDTFKGEKIRLGDSCEGEILCF